MAENDSPSPVAQRLVSLDVLRGFDMFWILGMEEVGEALAHASHAPWAGFISQQLQHAEWEGFHFLDLMFPLFIFISGVSLVFSVDKQLTTASRGKTVWKLIKRALLLYALGLFCYGGFSKGVEAVRWLGVLQRLAICGLAGGMAYIFLKERGRLLLLVGLLLGYWAAMALIPVPGGAAGIFTEGHNLANWVDAHYLAGFRWDGDHDPEGLLSTLPAIGTSLLGVLAGGWLKHHPGSLWRKAGGLAAAGVLLAALGWAWHPFFPVIKRLWTSSYVLVAGGYSLLLLSGFLVLVDGWKMRRGLAPFLWIGMNPITLYLSHHILSYSKVSQTLLGGPVAQAFGSWGEVLVASGTVFLGIGLSWFLYSRKIFLRV